MLSGAPGADPLTGARPLRDAWAWAVLPASAARVAATGGSLPRTLAAAGLEVCDLETADVDALLVDGHDELPERLWEHPAPLIAVALGGGPDVVPERSARARRAAGLALSTARVPSVSAAGSAAARAARAAGRTVTVTATGDRARPYMLGSGGLLRPRHGSIVAARRDGAEPSALGEALTSLRGADPGLGAPGATSVVESGKLIVRLPGADGAPGAVLRAAGGPARELVDRTAQAATALGAGGVPDEVRRVLPEQLVAGRAGAVAYAAERWVTGEHPRGVDDALWHSCREFLEALWAAPVPERRAGSDIIRADAELIAPLVSPEARARLERLAGWVGAELEGVRLGWAHGDFWPDNLIVSGGALDCVLDWDTSEPHELPVLDALDLLGFARPEDRWVTFGPRMTAVLLPLVRSSSDARLAEHCRSVGAPDDARGREALAWAWWARRTALTVRDYPDRRARPLWLAENLDRPLLEECPA